jgi:hypothetical protein
LLAFLFKGRSQSGGERSYSAFKRSWFKSQASDRLFEFFKLLADHSCRAV